MPENPAIKEQLAKDAEARKKSNEEAAKRMEASKPTPSQEENDRARLGDDVSKKEDDGSGPEVKLVMTRQVEADKPGQGQAYQTRQIPPKQQGG